MLLKHYSGMVFELGKRLDHTAVALTNRVSTILGGMDRDLVVVDPAYVLLAAHAAGRQQLVTRKLQYAGVVEAVIKRAIREAGTPLHLSGVGMAHTFQVAAMLAGERGEQISAEDFMYGALTSAAPTILWMESVLGSPRYQTLRAAHAPELALRSIVRSPRQPAQAPVS